MAIPTFQWPAHDRFIGRERELSRLERWWEQPDAEPLNVFGRRRVGKSWLLRRFAHGKPGVVLVADRRTEGDQMARFAADLAPLAGGVRPAVADVGELFVTLHRLAASTEGQMLVVLDEFPWLLGTTAPAMQDALSRIQAELEDADRGSGLRLVLCGSAVAQMEAMQAEGSPLHGRLQPLHVQPLHFTGAAGFLRGLAPQDAFTRYAIAGGMPRYLAALGDGPLDEVVIDQLLDRDAPLLDEGRTIVSQELREPATYFSIVAAMARGKQETNEISQAVRVDRSVTSRYVAQLEELRIVERRLPVGAGPTARSSHWQLVDPFLRFWFRFVFPFQSDIEAGLPGRAVWDSEVVPVLSEHVAPVFESLVRHHVRADGGATQVGAWWGNAADEQRRSGERSSEEIDVVGVVRNRVVLVGEVKWTSRPLASTILRNIDDFKVPALRASNLEVVREPRVLLAARSGYSRALVNAAATEERIELLDLDELLGT